MTVELEQQLRDYVSHVVELSSPVDIETPPRGAVIVGTGPPRRQRRPRLAMAAAAAVVVLVLIGGLAVGYRLLVSESPPVITQTPTPSTSLPSPTTTVPSPTTTVPSPSTTLKAVAPVPLMNWQQVPLQTSLGADDLDHDYVMHAVITGGPGLIAGGQVRPLSDSGYDYVNLPTIGTEATIWTSEDGVTWDRIPPEVSGLDGPGGYMIHDLTRGGPGYIAVGAALEDGQAAAAVWVSADGISWNRVESPSFVDEAMFAVSAGDDGIVAVGGGPWYSQDGLEWYRAETPAGFGAWDVAHADWGYIAVGTRSGPLVQDESGEWVSPQRPYAWTSQDGLSWEGVDLHPTDEWIGAEVYSVITNGSEVVVAGSLATTYPSYFDSPPAFWTTSDGSQWSETALDSVPVPGMTKPEALIEGLATTDSGMVAAGSWMHRPKAPGDEGWARAAVWATVDGGSTWAEVPAGNAFGEGSWMWDVVVLDGVAFAVGDHAGGAAIWIGEWSD